MARRSSAGVGHLGDGARCVVLVVLSLSVAGCSLIGGGGGPDPDEAAAAVEADVVAALSAVDPSRSTAPEVDASARACGGFDGLQDSEQETVLTAVGPEPADGAAAVALVDSATTALETEGWEVSNPDRDTRPEVVTRWFRGPDDATLRIDAQPDQPVVVEAITGCFDV